MCADYFVPADVDLRIRGPFVADERATYLGHLRRQRQTLELKCDGLDAADLASRSAEPSSMSLLGLVRHMADVERGWFRQVMAGLDAPPHFRTETDRDAAFNDAAPDAEQIARAWEIWRAEAAFADQFTVDASSLDITGSHDIDSPVSLRWLLVHMIEEYARHLGHADLLRERIDGRAGL
ncbi:MAG TPA: DinB family protein [Pseudonocardiaceae bacterium]|nr:DinB family protein [Pseudonocardiaceae bacterium]